MNMMDFYVTLHEKDLDVFRLSIDSIFENIPVVNRVFVVTKCMTKDVMYRDKVIKVFEPELFGEVSYNQIFERFEKSKKIPGSRAGWVWQQLLKLNADLIVKDISECFIAQDADLIWKKPQSWTTILNNVEGILGIESGHHPPYAHFYQRLMKKPYELNFSTIRHHAVFKTKHLKSLRRHIEAIHNASFEESILNSLDYFENSNMSEYDLYSNWLFHASSGAKDHVYQLQLNWKDINHIPDSSQYAGYDYVAAQRYLRS
jgi:hypothetical protein